MAEDRYLQNRQKVYDLLKTEGYTDEELGGSAENLFKDKSNAELAYKALTDAGYDDLGEYSSFQSKLFAPETGASQTAVTAPEPPAPSTEPEDASADLDFSDEPDTRALKPSRKEMIARQQEAMRQEEQEARQRKGMTAQQRTSMFNMESQERDRKYATELAERNPEAFLEAQTEEKAVEEARKAELATQKQTAEDVAKYGTGNDAYSFEDAVSAGKEFEAISSELEGFDDRLAAFNEKSDKVSKGKLRLSPEEFAQMQKEGQELANIAKRYDAVMKSAPGQEYKDISERLTEIANGPKSAKSAYDYSLVYAELQRNPIYRASLGADAPSEDEINAGLLQGQIAYLEEEMKTAKGAEKKGIKKAYSDAKEALYANPYYKKHLEQKIAENQAENERIGLLRSERAAQVREHLIERNFTSKGKTPTAYDQSFFWQYEKGDPELQRLDAAAHMHDDAIREYEKPTKYDETRGRRNVAKGLGDWASDTDTWSFGIESFVEDIAVVRPVLEKVEKIVGNVSEDAIMTDGAIDSLEKQLTPGELAVLDAYFEKVGAVAAKGADTAIGYQIGQGIGDMITLGVEMIATGGVGGVARKATEKGLKKAMVKILGKRAYRKLAKSGAGKVALWAGSKIPSDIVETAVRMPFMPSTYKNLGEKAVTLDEGYKTRSFKEYAPEAAWDQFVDQLTEVSNGFAFPLMGKIVKTPGMQKLFKETLGENGVRALRSFMERGDIKLLDDAMLGSFGGEWEEELLGAVIHSVTDDPKALSDFFSAEQQLVLLGTLAPLPISRGAVGGVQLAVPAANAAYRWNRAEAELKRLGLDEGRISRLKEVLDNASAPEGARAIMEAMRDAEFGFREAENQPENDVLAGTIDAIDGKAYGELARYFWAAQQKRAAGLMGEIQADQKVAAKRAELEQNLGGTFYHPLNGEDVVEIGTLTAPDGSTRNIYVTSEQVNSNGELAYVGEDGSKGFVNPNELGDSRIIPVDRYLAGLVMQDAQVQEAEGVINEAVAVNQSLRQQVESLEEVTYQGQTGTISRASSSDEAAVFVPDDGENVVVPWEELAAENGIAVPEVTTQEEKTVAGVDAVTARFAAQQQIADAYREAYSASGKGLFIDTEDGRMAVIDIIEDTIDPDEGTAEFTVRQPDGTRNVTMRTSIERVMAGLQGQAAPAEEPAPAPAGEPVAEQPAEEPKEEAPKIPVDKNGEKIYDAPGVSVEDALEDIYTTEGITEEMADEYIRDMAAEAEKGRNPKRGKMNLADWGKATAEANRKADFWKEMKEFADANTAEREREQKEEAERQERIKQYGVDPATFDMTPQTVEEAVAEYLGNSEKLIDLDDAIRETLGRRKDNRVPRELFRHLGKGGILVKNGGRSVQDVANDIVGEYEGTLAITQDDVRTAIIDALLGKTKTELRDTIFDNRLNEARTAADMFGEEPAPVEEPAPAPVVEEPEPSPEPEAQPEPAPEPEAPVEEPAEEPVEEPEAPAEEAPAEEPEATEEETTEQPAVPVQAQPTTPEGFGAGNKIFTKEAKDKARETILRKLKGQLNAGIDPEMLTAMIQYCGYYIEAGVRAFTDFAKSAIADLGDAIRPYLKSMYNAVRDYPDMGEIAKEMTPYDEVAAIDVNTIGNEEPVDEPAEPAPEKEQNKVDYDAPLNDISEIKDFMQEIGYKGKLSKVFQTDGKKFVKYDASGSITPNIYIGETTRRDILRQFFLYSNVMGVNIPNDIRSAFEKEAASARELRDQMYADDREKIKKILNDAGIPFVDVIDSERGSRIVYTNRKSEGGNYMDYTDHADPDQVKEDIEFIRATSERLRKQEEKPEQPKQAETKYKVGETVTFWNPERTMRITGKIVGVKVTKDFGTLYDVESVLRTENRPGSKEPFNYTPHTYEGVMEGYIVAREKAAEPAPAPEKKPKDELGENETKEIRDAVDAIVSGKDKRKRTINDSMPVDYKIAGKDVNSYIRDRYDKFKAPLEKRREELRKELVAYRDRIEEQARKDFLARNPHIKEDNPHLPDYVSEEADKRLKNDAKFNELDSQIKAIDNEIGNYQERRYNAVAAVSEIYAKSEVRPEESKENPSESPEKSVTLEGEEEAREKFTDTVANRLIASIASGERPFKSITDLRRAAREAGMEVDDRGATDILIQELTEVAIVRAARKFMSQFNGGLNSRNAFNAICKLYEMQPTISMRSNQRVAMQQYSTPLPMSFVAQMFAYRAGVEDVLEPTAGNGMLVFGIPADKVHANELDATRKANLDKQGFKEVAQNDATEPFSGEYDAVVANPPFGSHDAVQFDGKSISGLDPIITLRALDAMKDDGRAAIIIGGNVEWADNGSWKTKKAFFSYLYDHYNVKGVVNMGGQLYNKQGTNYPTMMILIDGRRSEAERATSTVYPPVRDKARGIATTNDELFDLVTEILNDNRKNDGNEVVRTERERKSADRIGQTGSLFPGDDSVESPADGVNGGRRENGGGSVQGPGADAVQGTDGTGTPTGVRPAGERSGAERDVSGAESGELAEQAVGRGDSGVQGDSGRAEADRRGGGNVPVGDAGREQPESVPGRESAVREPVRIARKIKDKILSYIHHSRARSLESVAPAAMVEDMDASIQKIEKELGRTIDDFVTEELGYNSTEELHKALAAEQIDSVAMAIYQMKQGKAMIIGDQTGVGKGRQVAALIRWANRQGKKPVFMTQKAGLFSDIYRDLRDIGSGDLNPLILNSATMETDKETGEKHWSDTSGVMLDEEGNVKYRSPKSGLDKIIESGKVPDEYDFVVLTYSQLNNGDQQSRSESKKKVKDGTNPKVFAKAAFVRQIVNDNYILLDESHTAAGEDSNSGAFLRSVMPSVKGVTFSSATFAKRPDTMPLYAIKSAMSEANVEPNKLIAMIKKGGVTLQEIMSRALTRSGQMVRRERDMSDVKTDWKTVDDPATAKKARANYDRAIEIFNKIIQFQRNFITPVIDDISRDLAEVASSAGETSGTKNFGVDNPPFVSQTYNFTKQLMLALKAEAIVDEVVKEIKAGRHPVIALENTYESGLDAYAVGDKIEDTSFSAGLLRSLGRILQYTVTDPDGNKSQEFLTPEELGPEAAKQYYALQDEIREATKGIFLSPLDLIKERLTGMGYNVGEVTGRKTHVVKEDDGYYRRERVADAKQAVRDFNSGASDVIIINKSGSTGISLHSSVAFKDQRPRSMIIAQPLGDINDYMQMIGRIDRTGQVHRGYYINLSLPVPAELRFNMMLASKLKSLNANTTTSQESDTGSVEAPDFLNKYGSQVVIEYLRDNPDVFSKLVETGMKLGGKQNAVTTSAELENYRAMDEDIQKVTGRIALLPVEEQEKFYADISERYNTLIKYLDETGENTLKITTLPLKAKTLARRVGTEGKDPGGNNPFAQNSYVERVEVDVLRKPMKADEIRKVRETLTGGKEFGEYRDGLVSRVNEQEKARLAAEEERYNREKEKTQKEIDKQVSALEAKVKNMDEVTRRAEISRITGRLTANLEEKHKTNVASIKSMHRKLREKFEQFNTDDTYLVYEELEGGNLLEEGNAYSPALFCGFKVAKAGENVTPSTSVAVFATLDGRRRLEIKFTSDAILDEISNFTNKNYWTAKNTTIDNWDSSISNASREERYILTGNILQAWDDATKEGVLPGRLVSYTDIDGNIHDGILMNQSWQPTQLRSSGAPINSRTEQILNGEAVRSTDGEVEIEHEWGDMFSIYVPKTKKAGAKYFENEDILSLIFRRQGFHQYRGRFTATVTRDNMRALLNILGDMGVRVNTEENESAWEEVGKETADQQSQDEEGTYFRQLTDPDKIAELEAEEKVPVYRSALFVPDPNGNVEFDLLDGKGKQRGFLYPPMSVKVDGKFRAPLVPGTYDEAEERPDLATDDGYFWLVDDNGDKMKVAYAPYLHNRVTPLNEQFAAAYKRNLVVIRSLVPKSELTSGYSAEKSRKATGMHDWPSGTVSNALAKEGKDTRKVILSRWAKIGEPVPYDQVADEIVDLIGDRDLAFEYNVVSPGLRKELMKRGVRFEGWHGTRPKNADSLIASMQPQFNRSGENLSSPIDRARAITTIDGIAKKLGVEFEQDSSLKAKGAFNPKTGKIRINIDAHKDTADLEATLLHEAVAHYGLRKLFGKDWKALRSRLYEQASPEIKAKVDALAKADGLSTEVAMEEYIAQLAEDGRFDAQEESFWQRIVTALKRLLAKIGVNAGYLTDEDFRAMLYASYRNLQTGGALETAARVGVYQALRRNADASHEDNGPEDDGPDNGPEGGAPVSEDEDMLDRDLDEGADLEGLTDEEADQVIDNESEEYYRRDLGYAEAQTADDMYDRATSTVGSALYASQVDEYAPLDDFQEAIVKEKRGKDASLTETEKVSNRLRELGGRAMNEVRRYSEKFLKPMWGAIKDFRKAVKGADGKKLSMEELTRYVGMKSGLERNELFAKRDAKRDAKAFYDKKHADRKAELNAMENEERTKLKVRLDGGLISDVTYQGEIAALEARMQQLRDRADADHDAHVQNVDNETAGEYRRLYGEYRQKDYSGLMAWFTEAIDLKRSDYPSRKAYQKAVNEASKWYVRGITDLASAEAAAKRLVDDIERQAGSRIVGNLWDRINAATKETLELQYQKGMISRQQKADIAASMKFYIPMRGFEDETAEDLYSYYMKPNASGFAPTIIAAKGRRTRYRSPFGMIGFMHSSAVSQGMKNEAKLSLLDFVRRHPKNTLATISRAWFVQTGEVDEDGKPIYEVAYPQVPEGATVTEREAAIEAFEQDMAQRKAQGQAYNAHREVQMNGGVVAFERDAHKTEHVIRVMEGGREYGIIVNGNPAAAQAVNGIKRQGGYENFLEILRATRRVMSQMFTTFSIPFWISNFQRDHGQGFFNTFVRDNPGYVGRYILNRWKILPQMLPLVFGRADVGGRMDRLSPRIAEYYRMYLENGGPMGQNRIETDAVFERQLERYLRLEAYDKAYIVRGASAVGKFLGSLGEAVETITRFSTFVTSMEYGRSVHEAISDSKEVSTNFARKGHGRSISWEETGRMETRSGRQLGDTSGSTFETYRNYVDRALIVSSSAVLELLRAGIPFFNAAIQGMKNKVDTYKKNWVKALMVDGICLAAGFAMRFLLGDAGGDDDKEKYGHTSDYARRNNLLLPLDLLSGDGKRGGMYSKWALPQEYRYMYALGDIIAEGYMKEKPLDDLWVDAFEAFAQVLPAGAVDPSAKGQAFWIDALKSVAPGAVTPIIEAFENRDFKGSRIYNEGFNGNKERDPGWTKAIPTTGKGYVKAAEWLNKVTGGDEENATVRGWLDLNPAIVEHFVQSYLSGPYQVVGGIGTLIGKAGRGEDITTRDIPVWNRMFLNTNDNSRDAYYSGLYYYFKDRDKEARRLDAGMKGHNTRQHQEFLASKDHEYMLVFKRNENKVRALNKQRKNALEAGDDAGVKRIDAQLDGIREDIAKECLAIYFRDGAEDKVK